jgi:FAD/FMN-containing dehydrogenase
MTTPSDAHAIDALGERHPLLRPGDAGYSAYTRDVVLEGRPDAIARPRTVPDLRELLPLARDRGIPVTLAGGQTSLTGASVAESGVLVSTEHLDRLLDIGRDPATGRMVAIAEPGIFLGDFQRQLADAGWLYPPDPTSRNEARLGATVATNATGEDTLLYGPTRRWVRELEIVRSDGTTETLRRSPTSRPVEEKATAGYYAADAPIDLLIGSEGTLAAITRVTVDLVPRPHALFSGVAFFPDLLAALRFVVAARQDETLTPRALELIDGHALALVAGNPEGIQAPAGSGAAIVFKQEYRDESERDRLLAGWFARLESVLRDHEAVSWLDAVLLVDDESGRKRLRAYRHRIPATLNEVVERTKEHGGGKVGTDWWVPLPHVPDVMEGWRRRIEAAGLRYIVFGHIGNGHPHWNFIPRDGRELARARALALDMCREAVSLGGGVAGEHGLGKLKRALLAVQYPETRIRDMRAVKRAWDPQWILGRGNLFEPEDS